MKWSTQLELIHRMTGHRLFFFSVTEGEPIRVYKSLVHHWSIFPTPEGPLCNISGRGIDFHLARLPIIALMETCP